MVTATLHVFVSSTWLDLRPEREAVEGVMQRLRGVKLVGMEYFGSRGETTRDASFRAGGDCFRAPGLPGLRGRVDAREMLVPRESRAWQESPGSHRQDGASPASRAPRLWPASLDGYRGRRLHHAHASRGGPSSQALSPLRYRTPGSSATPVSAPLPVLAIAVSG